MIYTVTIGEHDFKPNNQPFFTASNKIEGEFILDESMYFTREDSDYTYGGDVADWNKIEGLTWFLTSNSNRSAMFVWRPNESKKNVFQVAGYVNPRSGGFIAKQLFDVAAGETIEYQLIHTSNTAFFKMRKKGATDYVFQEIPFRNLPWWFRFYRGIGPWFGGNRAAHKEMTLQIDKR